MLFVSALSAVRAAPLDDAVASLPGYGAPALQRVEPVEGGQRVVVTLPRLPVGGRP